MAAGAETVVVLHVIPADRAEPSRADRRDGGGCGETDLDAALARFDPRDDPDATAPQVHKEPRGDRQPDEEAADLEPLRQVEEETQHRSHTAWQWRRADGSLLEHQHAGSMRRAPLIASLRRPAAGREAAQGRSACSAREETAARMRNASSRSTPAAAP